METVRSTSERLGTVPWRVPAAVRFTTAVAIVAFALTYQPLAGHEAPYPTEAVSLLASLVLMLLAIAQYALRRRPTVGGAFVFAGMDVITAIGLIHFYGFDPREPLFVLLVVAVVQAGTTLRTSRALIVWGAASVGYALLETRMPILTGVPAGLVLVGLRVVILLLVVVVMGYLTDSLLRDVAMRKRAEESLRRHAARQEAIAEVGEAAIVSGDLDTLFDIATNAVAGALGSPFTAVLEVGPPGGSLTLRAGMGWDADLVGEVLIDGAGVSPSALALSSGSPIISEDYSAETRFVLPPVLADHGIASGIAVTIRTGEEPFGAITAQWLEPRGFDEDEVDFVRMIADMLAQVIRRKRAEAELVAAEARFRTLVEQSPVIVFRDLLDDKATTAYVSPQVERILGYTQREWEADPSLWLISVHPEDRERAFLQYMRGREIGEPWTMEYRIRSKDGRLLWFRDHDVLLRDAAGVPIGVQGMMVDITDAKNLQEAQHETERAEQANRAKTAFLSRMSHELRTPLNSILGFGQLLQMEELSAREKESVGQILVSGNHLLELINEVLDLSRIESNRLDLSLEPVQAGRAFDEVLDMVRVIASSRRVDLARVPTLCEEVHVLADRQRLRQVLLNLLSNAVKYNRERGSVTLACKPGGDGMLRLEVTDTGAGIPRDRLDDVFSPFERLGAEKTKIGGTGLGLALSKRLVEAMGGTIGVSSEPGEGSTFWVEMPVAEAAEAGPRRTPAGDAELPGSVLCIEENPVDVKLLEGVLRDSPGVRVMSAMQGRLGLDLAREHRPEVVIVDVNLPDMAAESVIKLLKSDPRTNPARVVVTTDDPLRSEAVRLKAAGAYAYLTKPLDVEELIVVLSGGAALSMSGRERVV